MFERFTDRARRVVVLAQEEARGLKHGYIGTEHVLLGLIHEGSGLAAQVMESLSVSLADVRAEVVAMIGVGKTDVGERHIPFTPRAKKCLELSLREALALGHNYIGTEHILLGLIREGEGVAAQILTRRGLQLEQVREAVVARLQVTTQELAQAAGEGHRARRTARARGPRSEPVAGPACPGCEARLAEKARYSIVEVPEYDGKGTAQALFLFCTNCGHTLHTVVLPGES